MKMSPTPVDCAATFQDDVLGTDGSATIVRGSSTQDSSPLACSSASPVASETLFIQNLEVAARGEADLAAPVEPRLLRALSSDREFTIERKDQVFRREYIDRLTTLRVIRPQLHNSHQTIAIFDWDDTILPTTFLYHVKFENIRNNVHIQDLLAKLDKNIAKVLEKAVRVAQTYIITNAMKDWVETSSEMYLPLTHDVIQRNKILIISARHEYEEAFPNDTKRWKMETFLDLSQSFESSIPTNIICLGDSEVEMDAAHALGRRFTQSVVKTVKFKQHPRPEELIKQHELMLKKFDQIYTTLRTLSIKLEKKN